MAGEKKYFYGPVPSRRLGRSFGVDIVPFKVCTLDCVYCQLGRTTEKSIERKAYVPAQPIIAELKDALDNGLKTDYITIAGSGEPTLNSSLGEIVEGIKIITNIPIAIVTNGTLLYRSDVRSDCAKADVVLPSLDAGDERTFKKINRPHRDISIEKLVSGLCSFRKEFTGQIWLEVFVVDSINTGIEEIAAIRAVIERISPDKVQLNTAVRPTAKAGINKLDERKLVAIAQSLGGNCEIIADFPPAPDSGPYEGKVDIGSNVNFAAINATKTLFSMLKRRPCSLDDICSGMSIGRNEALKYVTNLLNKRVICSEEKDGKVFFKVVS
ncbi:MAG: radical SAM protein [Sedimentisphaerales bacterium]|nr:radical SAM protein [Sedimentisphaerales bacterium]